MTFDISIAEPHKKISSAVNKSILVRDCSIVSMLRDFFENLIIESLVILLNTEEKIGGVFKIPSLIIKIHDPGASETNPFLSSKIAESNPLD